MNSSGFQEVTTFNVRVYLNKIRKKLKKKITYFLVYGPDEVLPSDRHLVTSVLHGCTQ